MNFYRRFIKGYSQVVGPLSELTRKDKEFQWTDKAEVALNKLKELFTSAPILTTFCWEKHIVGIREQEPDWA
jgi:hypothetical protein